MFSHYFNTALRHFRRSPAVTLINVISLALGLACFVIGYGIAAQWSATDRHFPNADRIYAVTQEVDVRGNATSGAKPSAAYHVAKYIKADFPELEAVARAVNWSELPAAAGDRTASLLLAGADPEFLDIFNLPFSAGDSRSALRNPRSLVLTTDAARRLFGAASSVGRSVRLGGQIDVTVTGVSDPPQPSHIGRNGYLRYDMLASWDVIEALIKLTEAAASDGRREVWVATCCITYALLPQGGSFTAREFRNRLAGFGQRHVPKDQLAIADVRFDAVPAGDIEVAELERVLLANSGIAISIRVLLLSFASVVLAVACLNYANLAGAEAVTRSRELGLLRVLGADRRQLLMQFVFEATLLTIAACVVAALSVVLAIPVLRAVFGIDIAIAALNTRAFLTTVGAVVVFVLLAVSSYPALVAARVQARVALRGTKRGTAALSLKLFVGVQFAVASVLLTAVLLMYKQNHELERTGLGSGADQIVVITNNLKAAKVDLSTLRAELLDHAAIQAVASTSIVPWTYRVVRGGFSRQPEPGSSRVMAFSNTVSDDFFKVMGFQLLAGRFLDGKRATDFTVSMVDADPNAPVPQVVDRSLCRQLGYTSPQEAVGQIIYQPNPFGKPAQPTQIVGVVEDKPLHFIGNGSTSNAYGLVPATSFPVIRVSGEDIAGGLAAIDRAWRRLAPGAQLQRRFADDLFNENYRIFGRISQMFAAIAILALVVAAMGLIGMAIHLIGRRTHEIGVRKTLGASVMQILTMLLRDFSKPVLIANLLSWPVAFVAGQIYLSVFIHKTRVTAGPFVLGLLLTVVLAWLSISIQAARAARVRPSTVLRYE
jgi:putative ABC transport system permease protein